MSDVAPSPGRTPKSLTLIPLFKSPEFLQEALDDLDLKLLRAAMFGCKQQRPSSSGGESWWWG